MAETKRRERLRRAVASEVRVAMVRREITGAVLAQALGKSEAYVSRRLAGDIAFDVDDLEVVCETLQVKVADLMGHAERGDGSYVSVGSRPLDVTGAGYPVITSGMSGITPHPGHPVLAGAVPIAGIRRSGPRKTEPTGR